MSEENTLFKGALRVMIAIAILSFINGLLSKLTNDITFALLLPAIFMVTALIVSLVA